MQPGKSLRICLPCASPAARPHHDICQGWFWLKNGTEKVPCECLHGGSSGVPPVSRKTR